MKVSFSHKSASGDFHASDDLVPFFLWLAAHRDDPRATSLLVLVAEHERETSEGERWNIRRTIREIQENK